jgi:inner membrane transporter RhtA
VADHDQADGLGFGAISPPGARVWWDGVPPVALLVVAMSGFQAGSAMAIKGYRYAGPLGISLIRLTVAAAILFAVLRPQVRRWQRRQLMLTACFGAAIACIILNSAEASSGMPLGIVVTIATLGPLAVGTITRRRRVDCLWALLAVTGVALIAGLRGSVNLLGVIFAVG